MDAIEYQRYLSGIHWKQFRRFVLRERGSCCEECGISNPHACMAYGKPLNVHHLHYNTLGKEKEQDVRVLCDHCHERTHGKNCRPDFGGLLWILVRTFKESPHLFSKWMQTLDQVPKHDERQLILGLA